MGVQLQSKQEIAGFPVLKIRNLLRGIGDGSIRKEWLIEKGFSQQAATLLFEALIQNEYIEPDLDARLHGDKSPFYKLTGQGRSLGRASGAKRVQRETAELVLSGFMARVQEINDDPRFLIKVAEVVLFGSYLSDKETLGDLDIACKYEFKFASSDTQAFAQKLKEHFKTSGRSSKGIADLFWPWEQVRLHLKHRKRTISLHDIDEVEQMMKDSNDFRFEVVLGDREAIITRSVSK